MSRLFKLAVVMACAIVASAAIAACGDDSTTAGDTSATSTQAPPRNGYGGNQDKKADEGKDANAEGSQNDGGDSGNGGSEKDRTHSRAEVETPLKVSGGGSTQFIQKGGDNSIAEYGDEADESELQEVAEIVHNFYVARAVGDWSRACSYLTADMHKQFEQLGEQSGVKGCPAFLESFTSDVLPSVWKELTTVDAVSLRHDGEQAFLIYRGAEKTTQAIPLHEEDGEWKVTALSAVPIG